jgi:Xaa-Pro dipeptidase
MNVKTQLAAAPASYSDHIRVLSNRYDEAMRHCGLKAIVVHSGELLPLFLDDQHYPHKPNPHLLQWLPLFGMPDACLVYESGKQPRLLVLTPDDFWHAAPELPHDSYLQHFDTEIYTEAKKFAAALRKLPRKTGIIDPADEGNAINPEKLLNFLHYYRSIKTDYEVECISAATAVAVDAHRAAREAFDRGDSGFGIHLAFLQTAGCSEPELPYPDIIACNQSAAVLHYEKRTHTRNPHSLLIDAGTAVNGYACDITRTHSANPQFAELIEAVNTLQQSLCNRIRPGISFGEAQHSAHLGIGRILRDHNLANLSPETMVTKGVTAAFFPHGLGHMLGLQVHDVGGHMADISGKTQPAPKEHPHLRMTRTLEPGMVLTIEPGLYFIPMLLNKLKTIDIADKLNWAAIERLATYGGIRIEDNILVTATGARNITREHEAMLSNR